MRKTIIFLIILIGITNGCGQAKEKQTETIVNIADTITPVYPIETIEDENICESQLFSIQRIDAASYFAFKENANKQVTLEKLTDLEEVKEILKGRVVWAAYDDEAHQMKVAEEGEYVYKVVCDNGKTTLYDYPEVGFIAYYPGEDILFLEGGHCSSLIFNLTTGEEEEKIGDPDYWCDSSSGRYRFNGYYNGQASEYFIQEKSEGNYETIIELDYSVHSDLARCLGFIPEYIPEVFWENDSTLNFMVSRYYHPEDKTEKFYYRLIIK